VVVQGVARFNTIPAARWESKTLVSNCSRNESTAEVPPLPARNATPKFVGGGEAPTN